MTEPDQSSRDSRGRTLLVFTMSYSLVAGTLMLADSFLTNHLLELNPNAYELNLKADTTSTGTLVKGALPGFALFVALFFASFAVSASKKPDQQRLGISGRWEKAFIGRVPGTLAIWYVLLLTGAVVNNGGMILFDYSWLQNVFNLFGFQSDNQRLAAFSIFPLASLLILFLPAYLIFGKVAGFAERSANRN